MSLQFFYLYVFSSDFVSYNINFVAKQKIYIMKNILFILICFLLPYGGRAEEARLLRFPHINGNQIVFSYAGDLYTATLHGGNARKLTSHIGYEMFPRIFSGWEIHCFYRAI